jgi:hypothetical protein
MKSSLFHFVVALIALIAVLSGYGVWYSVVAAKSSLVANLQSKIDAKMETANRTASARAAMTEIASDETAIQSYFVPETSVVTFINNLEAQGQAQGTAVNVLSVSAGTGARPTLALSLTVKGTFDAVMRTVGAIEYAPYDLSVSQFSLEQDARNSWHANIGIIVGSANSKTATSTP